MNNVSIGTMVDHAAAVRTELLDVLRTRYGRDNVDPMLDDPASIGVGFTDGTFLTVRIQIPGLQLTSEAFR